MRKAGARVLGRKEKKNYSLLASMGKSVLTIFFLFAEQRRRFERCFYVNPRIKEELGNIDFFEQVHQHDDIVRFRSFHLRRIFF